MTALYVIAFWLAASVPITLLICRVMEPDRQRARRLMRRQRRLDVRWAVKNGGRWALLLCLLTGVAVAGDKDWRTLKTNPSDYIVDPKAPRTERYCQQFCAEVKPESF